MRIIELYLKGFGRFKDKKVLLGKGLNIIYGPNEAGKSTLHKFIEGMLFGFVKPGVKRRILLDDHQKYQPWDCQYYGGYMIYEVQGKRYRVERDFTRGREDVRIYDDISGQDVTGDFEYDKATREYLFCQEHTGINQTIFKNTISIGQLAVKNDDREMVREVGSRLSNLSTSGDIEVSVARAEKALENVLKEIGTEKAYTREYGMLIKKKEQLEEELASSREKVESIRRLQQRLVQIEEELQQVRLHREEVRQRIEIIRQGLLLKRWEEIKELKEREEHIKERLDSFSQYSSFPVHHYEELLILEKEIKDGTEEVQKLQRKMEEISGELKAAEERAVNSAYARIDEQDGMEAGKLYASYRALNKRAEDLSKELEKLEKELSVLKEYNLPDINQLNIAEELQERMNRLEKGRNDALLFQLKTRLEQLKADMLKTKWRAALYCICTLVSIPAALYLHPLLIGMTAISLILCLMAVKGISSSREKERQTVSALEEVERDIREREEGYSRCQEELQRIYDLWQVENLYQMRTKAMEYQRLQEKISGLKDRIGELDSELSGVNYELDEHKNQLKCLLERAGIHTGDIIEDTHIHSFASIVSRSRKDLEHISAVKRQLEELKDVLTDRKRLLEGRKRRLKEILDNAGVDTIAEYRDRMKGYNTYLDLSRELGEVQRLLQSKLEGADYKELEVSVRETVPAAEIPAEEITRENLSVVEKQLELLKEKEAQSLAAMEKIRGSMEVHQKDLVSPAELEEELERTMERIEVLERERQAASTALDIIREASAQVHREFAPVLNRKVEEIVSRITAGKYRELRVTKDLEILAVSPETGRQVSAHQLSGGTIDQIYFACRMAMADLLAKRPNLPLILDDSFVQYDIDRLRNIMAYLTEVSQERQIIIFTCHHRDREVAERIGGGFNYLEL